MKWKYGMLILLGLLLFGGVWGQCSLQPDIQGKNKTDYCRGDLVIMTGSDLAGPNFEYYIDDGTPNPALVVQIIPLQTTNSEVQFILPPDFPFNGLWTFHVNNLNCTNSNGQDVEGLPIAGINVTYPDTLLCDPNSISLSPSGIFPSTANLAVLNMSSMNSTFTVDTTGTITGTGTAFGIDTLLINTGSAVCPLTKVPFDIRSQINVSLSAVGSPYCNADNSTQTVSAASDFPGTYSVLTGSLTLFQDSLLIPANNISGSSEVVYTATYGNCIGADTVLLDIEPVTQAGNVYPGQVCEGSPSISPLSFNTILSFDGMSPNGGATINTSTGQVILNNATDTLEIFVTTAVGPNTCSGPDTIFIPIIPLEDSEFNISEYHCMGDTLLATNIATRGGNFYLYSISSVTGPILDNPFTPNTPIPGVPALPPGNYILEYESPGPVCISYTQKLFTITSPDSADISYPNDTICTGSPSSPIINLNPGGVFSSTGGLIVNPTNGLISSTAANGDSTYTITFQSFDTVCPAFEDTFMVHVKAYGEIDIDYQVAFACNDASLLSANNQGDPGTFYSLSSSNLFLDLDSLSGAIDPHTSDPGVHTILFETSGKCKTDTVLSLEIVERDDAEFHFMGNPFCTGLVQIVPPTPTALLGDTFTTSFANVVHPDSGWVYLDNLANNISPNDSSVTATITRETAGRCPDTFDTTITVFKGASAAFSYEAPAQCTSNGVLLPDFAASALGIFSATPTGIVWVDSTEGSIDLGQSAPGQYEIIKEIDLGQCSDTDTFGLLIEAPGSIEAQYEVFDSTFVNGDTVQYCRNHIQDPQAIVIPSTASATFLNINPPNDSIVFSNSISGAVDLDSSGVGLHGILVTLNSVCQEQDTAWVEILQPGNADFGFSSGPIICQSNEVVFALPEDSLVTGTFSDLSGGLQIHPSTGMILLDSVSPSLYTVQFTTDGRCSSVEEREIRILDSPELEIDAFEGDTLFFCEGDSIEFTFEIDPPSTSFGFLFPIGCLTTFNGVPFPTCGYSSSNPPTRGEVSLEGVFNYEISGNQFACRTRDTVHLFQKPVPTFLASPDSAITTYEASPFDLTLLPAADETEFTIVFDSLNALNLDLESYNFDTLIPFGGTPFTIVRNFTLEKPTTPGRIFAYIETEAKGCPGMKDTIRYNIQPNDFPIYIPEVFTPDGKGDDNDTWKVQCNKEFINPDNFRIEVYNRAGGKVYDMHRLHPNWRGTTNNDSPLPDGVYWWTLIDKTTNEVVDAGGVTIKRK